MGKCTIVFSVAPSNTAVMGLDCDSSSGPNWAPKVWPQITGEEPGEVMTQYYDTQAQQHHKDMKRKDTHAYKKQRKKGKVGIRAYLKYTLRIND